MEENQSGNSAVSGQAEKIPSGEEVRKSLDAEIVEMEKYKWNLGVHLQHDPLKDRSLNDIYCEWIDKYAADFRKFWEGKAIGDPSKKQ